MTPLQWSDELSVGVPLIDQQHKELIRIAVLALDAMKREDGREYIDTVINKLREYTVFHFRYEEELMESMHFPERSEHGQEHVRLKNEVKQFQRELYLHNDPSPQTVRDFVKDWLITHILTFDRNLAKFIHEREAEKEKTDESRSAKNDGPPPE
jgi:hemerythrin